MSLFDRLRRGAPTPDDLGIEASTWWVAVCPQCDEAGGFELMLPFDSAEERDAWVEAHRSTGHEPAVHEEPRT